MPSPESSLLARKYQDLPGSNPVERAVEQSVAKGEKGPKTKEERIDRYLKRLERIAFAGNSRGDRRGLELLKEQFLHANITTFEEIPDGYWKAQEEMARSEGRGGDYAQFSEAQLTEARHKHADAVLLDQRASLEQWVDYFGSYDSTIPTPLKYWILRSVIQLQEYDKDKKIFPKRSRGTVAPFPDINPEALGYIVDAVADKLKGKSVEFEYDIQGEDRATFLQALQKEDFASLYAWANELMHPIPERLLPITEGAWVKYSQGSDSAPLTAAVRGWGTGWCTAGEQTAKVHLQTGAFYLYKTLDDDGNPTIPRIAIRMEGDKIAEVRGIAKKQNLDPYMAPVLEQKLKEFPDGGTYLQKTKDMERLTQIDKNVKANKKLGKDDLVFLYEVDRSIQYFGYIKDPRIQELRQGRNLEADMLVLFECAPWEIAHSFAEVNKDTKAYVGPLEPGIFEKLPASLEHLYASFPESRIRRISLEIGGKTKEELKTLLRQDGHQFGGSAEPMMDAEAFTTLPHPEEAKLVRLTVADLGFPDGATTQEIFDRAIKLGLDLCPPEVGPHYRLSYTDQPMGEWVRIGMNPIAGPGRSPGIFDVGRGAGGSWLYDDWASPGSHWNPGNQFVFRLRKKPLKP